MGGIIGTLLMLTETSNCGAILDLDQIPHPENVLLDLEYWLTSFPSYSFLLSVCPENVEAVQTLFYAQNLVCAVVGELQTKKEVIMRSQSGSVLFWDFAQTALTGF